MSYHTVLFPRGPELLRKVGHIILIIVIQFLNLLALSCLLFAKQSLQQVESEPLRFQRGGRQKRSNKQEKLMIVFESAEDDSDTKSESTDGGVQEPEDPPCLLVDAEVLETDEDLKMHILGLSSLWTITVDTNFASRVRNLPTRHLPPGSLRMLHEQMKVDLPENKGISYMHFWRTFRQYWTGVLRFLPPSTHGTCDTCNNFKSLFKKTPVSDPQGRFEAAKAYRDHVAAVSKDRDLEEFLQAQNPLMRQNAPLCIHMETWFD